MLYQFTLTEALWAISLATSAGIVTVWALVRHADRRALQSSLAQLVRVVQLNADATTAAANGSGRVAIELGEFAATMGGVAASTKEANVIRSKDVSEKLALVADIRAGKVPHPSPSRPKASSRPGSIPPAAPSQPGDDNEITAAFDRTFFKSTTTLMSEGTASARPTLRGGKAVGT